MKEPIKLVRGEIEKSLTSLETKSILKISDCKLMHLRESGVLRAEKKGNAFLYHEDDVKEYRKINIKNKK